MNEAHFENLEHIHASQLVREGHGHEAQAPSVFGGAFLSARRSVRASEHALELFSLLEEGQAALDVLNIHTKF